MKAPFGKAASLLLSAALLMTGGPALAEEASAGLATLDTTRWQYNAEHDFCWQVGLRYCASPADPERETMGFFVPGAYMDAVDNGDGTYSFKQPSGKVTIKVTFTDKTKVSFVDVPASAYYYDAVLWAAEKGITGGVDDTHFAPNAACTRAQAVTFLWRAAGCPAPKSNVNPFTDVKAGSYYYDAVLWAVENGITKGTSDTTFSPDTTCTRGQIVTFLWRSQKSPASDSANPFTDVAADAYYADAVLWAVKEDITNGTSSTTFSPDADCTRAQIVTFLYRCLGDE